jgi:NAD(P)-dependent dehydrogenase (short-subunit alcohol dehydrogenase family)
MTDAQKIALVTGANRGIGRATALALADAGTDLIITYRSHADEAADVVRLATERGRQAVALELDTSEVSRFGAFADDVRTALKTTWDRDTFDHLVNNAGHGGYTPFAKVTEQEFDGLMNVHLKGVFFLTQALLPLLADGGRIINLSSGLTRFSSPGSVTYAAMKGGIEVFTKHLAAELGQRGITVNVVAPGPVATDFGGGRLRDNEQLRGQLAGLTALGRVGVADDIGPAIAAMLAPGTGWITGERIEVSGGVRI